MVSGFLNKIIIKMNTKKFILENILLPCLVFSGFIWFISSQENPCDVLYNRNKAESFSGRVVKKRYTEYKKSLQVVMIDNKKEISNSFFGVDIDVRTIQIGDTLIKKAGETKYLLKRNGKRKKFYAIHGLNCGSKKYRNHQYLKVDSL